MSELKGADKFTWVGTAYTLSSTAFQPLSGALADIFGRRPCMLGALTLFALGSALCGAAKDMPMLIAGRSEYSIHFQPRVFRMSLPCDHATIENFWMFLEHSDYRL